MGVKRRQGFRTHGAHFDGHEGWQEVPLSGLTPPALHSSRWLAQLAAIRKALTRGLAAVREDFP